jgi:hypothetical protein
MMDDAGQVPEVEELATLREQLEGARAEVARLQADAAHAAAEATRLRDGLVVAEDARITAESDASALRSQLDDASAKARRAAERYRDLVVRTEPALPAELIAGEDIDAVDAAVSAARDIVGRVRSHIEAQAESATARARVPAGAPARSSPDLSTMTPEQKIRYGLAAGR